MKSFQVIALSLAMSLTFACGKKKVEDGEETQGEAAKSETSGDATGTGTGSADNTANQPLTVLYPPAIGVYPLSAPDAGRSLYFGFSQDGTQKFEMIWVYAVAAIPDFSQALQLPEFNSQEEFDAFMEKWAAEFKANAEFTAALDKLTAEFSFKVDPAFFNDAAATIPAAALAGQPNYVKITQKFLARRYTTKAAGNTTITATAGGGTFSAPVVITAYTNAVLAAGKARYDNATTGCVGCHGNATANQDAFLKHSSDYLAYATDAEILNIVKNSAYPDGSLLNNGAHKNVLTVPEETAIVGYLRSFQPSFDKLGGVEAAPAALRLR